MARDNRVRRVANRVRRGADVRARLARLGDSIPAILQMAFAAGASYAFAHFVLGHEVPFLAATVVLSSISFSRDSGPRQVLETALGIIIGILFSVMMVQLIGKGWWQLSLVLLVTLAVARLLSPSAGFATAAGVQSLMVVVLPVPPGGPYVRVLDGLVGAVMALLVTALLPRDPRRLLLRDERGVLQLLSESLAALGSATRVADCAIATDTLARLRSSQPQLDNWASSLDSAVAIARISPLLRRSLPELRRQVEIEQGLDLAIRSVRVVARRLSYLINDGIPRPQLAAVLSELAEAVTLLDRAVREPGMMPLVRQRLTLVALKLDPTRLTPGASLGESGIVLMLRPLLVAVGATDEEARGSLPPLG